jgi:hypothetical protein
LKLGDAEIARVIYSTQALNGLFKDTLAANGIKDTEANLVKLAKEGLAGFGIAADDATAAGADFNAELTATQQATQDATDSLADTASGFIDFATAITDSTEDGVLSLSAFMKTIKEQAQAQVDWQKNMSTLAAKGASAAFLAYLTSLGPSAAALIQEFTANPDALAKADALWTKHGGNAVAGWAGAFQARMELGGKVGAAFGEKARIAMMNEMDADKANIPAIMDKYNRLLSAHKLWPQLSMGDAQAQIDQWIRNNNGRVVNIITRSTNPTGGFGLGDGHATGGYISGPGTGTSDSIPARLSNGEFVMTAAATRRIGADNLYKLMHSAQRGYATGGVVTTSSASYVPSYGTGNSARNAGSAGTTVVELSAYDRQLLAEAGNVQLRIGNEVVARATNKANSTAAKRRSN